MGFGIVSTRDELQRLSQFVVCPGTGSLHTPGGEQVFKFGNCRGLRGSSIEIFKQYLLFVPSKYKRRKFDAISKVERNRIQEWNRKSNSLLHNRQLFCRSAKLPMRTRVLAAHTRTYVLLT
ncbi:uncharacterized protein LOC122531390 [Frieseomelitta varia]|uniref:uncharacterized protein LOC122531390 n=1 Tax=Frieseomelitta varia TaxID=561572 RepID=UPI001CB67A17|nr:uncharacterized protein LOC122531390 [Frieseomelitta varia]